MQASTKEVSNLLTSPGLHLILELVFSIGIKNQNFREEIPKWFVKNLKPIKIRNKE